MEKTNTIESWGKEPFDLRLTVLRLIRCLPGILAAAAVWTIVFGGGYYVKNILMHQERFYEAKAEFFVQYTDEDFAAQGKETYVNAYTWNEWMKSDEFAGYVMKYLLGGLPAGKVPGDFLKADVPSDLRVTVISSVSENPGEAEAILEAAKSAMVEDFPKGMREVESIRVINTLGAEEILPDVRPVRAFILAAVTGIFFAVLIFTLREILQERIWLPAQLTGRYGIPNTGLIGSDQMKENISHLFVECKTVAVCPAQEEIDPAEVVKKLGEIPVQTAPEWTAVPCPLLSAETAEVLRKADGILLVVKAGDKSAKNLEYLLDFLKQQDCRITAALLWEPDESLIRQYYCLPARKSGKE